MFKIAVIEGDGIGPEVISSALRVLEKLVRKYSLPLKIIKVEAGDRALEKYGTPLPEESYKRILESDAILKGPVGETAADVIVRLRRELDLYANIRPAKTFPGVPALREGIDMVIVRENVEDLYVGVEGFLNNDTAIAVRLTTRKGSERIARVAARYARARRGKVTIVHKANVLRITCGLFRDVSKNVLESEGLQVEEMYVDAAAMEMVRNPLRFDVLLTPNMFGDILSDLAAQVVGSLGLAPSGNLGDERALFEPVHGAAFDIAGKGIANPTATMLATAMMLEWLEERKGLVNGRRAAHDVEEAIRQAFAEGKMTRDLGGNLNTQEFTEVVLSKI